MATGVRLALPSRPCPLPDLRRPALAKLLPEPRSGFRRASPAPALAPLPLPRVLLCDLDGTLIDSMPTLAELATEVMEEVYGTPRILARELYLATCGLPFVKQLEEIYPGDPRNARRVRLFEARKPARCNRIRMPAETRRALERLRAAWACASPCPRTTASENVDTFAQRRGLPVRPVLGFGGGLAKGRPHIDAASRSFGVDRQEMLFVGDSLHDGEIAEREGVPFVGVAATFSPERFMLRFPQVPVIRRFAALPDLF